MNKARLLSIIDGLAHSKSNYEWAKTFGDKEYSEIQKNYARGFVDTYIEALNSIGWEQGFSFAVCLVLLNMGLKLSNREWASGVLKIENKSLYLIDKEIFKEWQPTKSDLFSENWYLISADSNFFLGE